MKLKKSSKVIFVNMLVLLIAMVIGTSGPAGVVLADSSGGLPPNTVSDTLAGSPTYGPDGTSSMDEEYAEWFILLNTLLT